jgi:hypothetical protein
VTQPKSREHHHGYYGHHDHVTVETMELNITKKEQIGFIRDDGYLATFLSS